VTTATKTSEWGDGSEGLVRMGSGLLRPQSGGVLSRLSLAVQEVAVVVNEHVRENWEDDE
jgi:hypothetical protein